MKIFIYTLQHPITKEIRYIGKTKSSLHKRLTSHVNFSKTTKGNRHTSNWIKSLLHQNLKPLICLIEECDENNWQEREIYWIDYFRKLNFNLCNAQSGGQLSNNKPIQKAQGEKHYKSVLSIDQVNLIRKRLEQGFNSGSISRELSIKRHLIHDIKRGATWKHLGLINIPNYSFDYSYDIICNIINLLKENKSCREISKITKINTITIYKVRDNLL